MAQTDEKITTRYQIKPLDGVEILGVYRERGEPDLVSALQLGLIGWENYLDENENQIAFSQEEARGLPPAVLAKIANRIILISDLTGAERKN